MSEDLFEISESQTIQLRRSRRLVTKKASFQQYSECEKIPLSQKRSRKTLQMANNETPSKIPRIENNIEDIQIELRSPTPDFTALIASSQNNCEQHEISPNFNGFNILQDQEKILEKTTKLPLNLCITKEQENKIETTETIINLITQPVQTPTEQSNVDKENKNETYQNVKKEKEMEAKVNISTPKTKKRTRESKIKPTFTATPKSVTKKKTDTSNQPKRRRNPTKTNNPKALSNTEHQVKTSTSTIAMKSNSIDILKPTKQEYVAPKIVRYYNSCPIMNDTSTFPYEHNPLHQSLLPPVYPSHFTNQISMTSTPIEIIPENNPLPKSNWSTIPNEANLMHQSLSQPPPSVNPLVYEPVVAAIQPNNENHSSMPILPTSLLTPDDSEIIVLEDSDENEFNATPSTPMQSPNLLFNFFEINEIIDLTDVNRPAYILTELQISALACVLKIDENDLYAKLDKIVEMKQENLMQFIQNIKNN